MSELYKFLFNYFNVFISFLILSTYFLVFLFFSVCSSIFLRIICSLFYANFISLLNTFSLFMFLFVKFDILLSAWSVTYVIKFDLGLKETCDFF